MNKKLLAGLALSAGTALGGAQLVGAASYPPGGQELVVETTVVTPGGTITVTIRGCLPGEIVRFTLANVSVEVTCSAGGAGDSRLMAPVGTGTATATLPVPTTPGTYTITAVGLTSGFTETLTITVAAQTPGDDDDDNGAAPGAGSGTGGLPATGSETNGTIWIAGGALTAGLALSGVAVARRRRPATI